MGDLLIFNRSADKIRSTLSQSSYQATSFRLKCIIPSSRINKPRPAPMPAYRYGLGPFQAICAHASGKIGEILSENIPVIARTMPR